MASPDIIPGEGSTKRLLYDEDLPQSTKKRPRFTLTAPPTPPHTLSRSSTPASNDTRPRIYLCHFAPCTASFTRPCRLAEHERSHTGERPFVCSHAKCGKTFSRDYHLSRHIALSHSDVRSHSCAWPGCDKAFATAQRRREHEKTHEKKKEFICEGYDRCDEVFRKKSTLAAHVAKVHLGVKPFSCGRMDERTGEACKSAYDSQGKLNEHVRKWHSGPRFFCTMCSEQDNQGQKDDQGDDKMEQDQDMTTPHAPAASVLSQGPGFLTLQELQEHKQIYHAASKPIRGRPRKPPGAPKVPKARRRANQHTAHHAAMANMSPASILLANATIQSQEQQLLCLLTNCPLSFSSLALLEEHCVERHGMALVEIAEAHAEREALAGGVFWLGGVEPGHEHEYEFGPGVAVDDNVEFMGMFGAGLAGFSGIGVRDDEEEYDDAMVLDPALE